MKNKRQVIPFRRKREGKTNYKKRIAYLTSGLPRLVIRRSLKNVVVQIITYEPQGDRVVASANSKDIKKLGWKGSGSNIPCAYLVGFLAGVKAKGAKINEAIADLGLYQQIKGSKIYAALKGAFDAGLKIPLDESVVPNAERLRGKHISEHRKVDAEKDFEEVLSKIKGAK
ncbi:50S ribosomal protein L18 [Candidatus Woesearchaeota archaeon]|nr:50S ribosomal protein L18 [Candidatus Woesearchaeota archaeon]